MADSNPTIYLDPTVVVDAGKETTSVIFYFDESTWKYGIYGTDDTEKYYTDIDDEII